MNKAEYMIKGFNEENIKKETIINALRAFEKDIAIPFSEEAVEMGKMLYYLLIDKWQLDPTTKEEFFQFPWGTKVFKKDFE